jgi:hypothetical protein
VTAELIKRVHGGFQVDGLDLLRCNCGCGGLTGPGGSGVGDCCLTYSTVKQENHTVAFFAKATTPNTAGNYEWGYRVKKGPVEVDVLVYDPKSPKIFSSGANTRRPWRNGKSGAGKPCRSLKGRLRGPATSCRSDARVRRNASGRISGVNPPHGDPHRQSR